MSFRFFELSPHASTGETQLRIVARSSRSFPQTSETAFRFWNDDLGDLGFDADDDGAERRGKWNRLLGGVLALGISGGLWTGIGWLIARLLR